MIVIAVWQPGGIVGAINNVRKRKSRLYEVQQRNGMAMDGKEDVL